MTTTLEYRGVTYIGTPQHIKESIEKREISERTIYRSSVYTYSCMAIRLDNGQIKLTEWLNNGSEITESFFDNEDLFWAR
jgi:hypothetical protein